MKMTDSKIKELDSAFDAMMEGYGSLFEIYSNDTLVDYNHFLQSDTQNIAKYWHRVGNHLKMALNQKMPTRRW